MSILSLVSGLVKLGAAFFNWLRDWQIFKAGRTAAERDQAHDTLSRMDKIKRFRDRVDSDPRYADELRKRFGEHRDDGLRVPPKAEDKPS